MSGFTPDQTRVYLRVDGETGAGVQMEGDLLGFTITAGEKHISEVQGVGTGEFTFLDLDRDWDPTNTESPYYGNKIVGAQIYARTLAHGFYKRWYGRVERVESKTWGEDSLPIAKFVCTDWIGALVSPAANSVNGMFSDKILAGGVGSFYSFTSQQVNESAGTVQDLGPLQIVGQGATQPESGIPVTAPKFDLNAAGDGVLFDNDSGTFQSDPEYFAFLRPAVGGSTYNEWDKLDWNRGPGLGVLVEAELLANQFLGTSDQDRYWPTLHIPNNNVSATEDSISVWIRQRRQQVSSPYSDAADDTMYLDYRYDIGGVEVIKSLDIGRRDEFVGERRAFYATHDGSTITLGACVPYGVTGTVGGGGSLQTVSASYADDKSTYADFVDYRNATPGFGSFLYGTKSPERFNGILHTFGVVRASCDPNWASSLDQAVRFRGINPPGASSRLAACVDGVTDSFPTGWLIDNLDETIIFGEGWREPNQNVLACAGDLVAICAGRIYQPTWDVQSANARVRFDDFATAQQESAITKAIISDQPNRPDTISASRSVLHEDRESLLNWVEVDPQLFGKTIASDQTSIDLYGFHHARYEMPFGDTDQMVEYAALQVARYKDSRIVCTEMDFDFPSSDAWYQLQRLEIGSRVHVERQPGGVGSVAELEQVVIGYRIQYDATSGGWKWKLHCAPWEPWRPDFSYNNSEAPPNVAAYTTATGAGGASLTLRKPDSVQVGDRLVMIFADDGTHGSSTWTAPSGWTLDDQVGDGTVDTHFQMMWRTADGTEPDSYTVAFANSATTTNTVGVFLRISNPRSTSWVEGAEFTGTTGGAAGTPPATTQDQSAYLAVASFRGTSDSFAWTGTDWGEDTGVYRDRVPLSWGDTVQTDSGGGAGVALSWRVLPFPTTGTASTYTVTADTTLNWATACWALRSTHY